MELSRHESSPSSAVPSITADVQRTGTGLTVSYSLTGDASALVIPPPAEPVRTDELWRTTCFELFLRGEGLAYSEFNFSPSGQWAAYAFDSYRNGIRELELSEPPRISIEQSGDCFTLTVNLVLQLPEKARIGLSAIIDEREGRKSYWALAHPEGPPDFHHDACFAATLPAIAAA